MNCSVAAAPGLWFPRKAKEKKRYLLSGWACYKPRQKREKFARALGRCNGTDSRQLNRGWTLTGSHCAGIRLGASRESQLLLCFLKGKILAHGWEHTYKQYSAAGLVIPVPLLCSMKPQKNLTWSLALEHAKRLKDRTYHSMYRIHFCHKWVSTFLGLSGRAFKLEGMASNPNSKQFSNQSLLFNPKINQSHYEGSSK